MALSKNVFCCCHIDGVIIMGSDRSLQHRGRRTVGVMVDNETTFNELIDLVNAAGMSDLLLFSDRYAHVYVRSSAPMQIGLDVCTMKPNEDQLKVCQGLASNSTVSSNVDENDADPPTTHVIECTASTKSSFTSQSWKNEIIATGQSFQDAVAFRQALYSYSVAHRFAYTFRRNTKSYISVYCKVEGCPWHLTAYCVGETKSTRWELLSAGIHTQLKMVFVVYLMGD
ncbi:hypothetical protein SLEP1_g24312 [Rubroshorea leprosula]|uniref:Transposase MuDR plant domain-containing protein n=1 Tax=Rubroshorea leprosula TaxID=152421 RepID=A0AAV5JPS5_9ROSI|nr:hypothetical protein SLEP1_g24312 [Rubroshorea leprosula]